MDIEPLALHFIMQDDLFLLKTDKHLYRTAGTAAPVEPGVQPIRPEAVISFNYRGNNKNGLLVLVHYSDEEFIAETHLTALENILKRLGRTIDDAAILNMALHTGADFESICGYFNPQKILLLGNKAVPEGLAPLNLNVPRQINAGVVLYSFSFDEMMDSNDNKKAFWEQMKLL